MFLQAVLLLAPTSWELEFFLTSWHRVLISVHCGTCGILKIGPTCLFRRSLVVKDLWNHSTPWVPWHDFTGGPLKFWEVAPRSLLRGLETFYSPKLFFPHMKYTHIWFSSIFSCAMLFLPLLCLHCLQECIQRTAMVSMSTLFIAPPMTFIHSCYGDRWHIMPQDWGTPRLVDGKFVLLLLAQFLARL